MSRPDPATPSSGDPDGAGGGFAMPAPSVVPGEVPQGAPPSAGPGGAAPHPALTARLDFALAGFASGLPADAVPGYTLIRELGRGAQAVVYLATQRSTNRAVAVRVTREGPFASAADRARFEREVRVLANLDHPGVVPIVDFGVTAGGAFFIAMKHVAGRPLDAWLADRPAAAPAGAAGDRRGDQADLLRLFVRVCDAVDAAHRAGVVHRDLKPSNILVTPAGDPYVVDFGLARFVPIGQEAADAVDPAAGGSAGVAPLTITGQFLGSLPWASPEQADGRAGRVDARSDVYALGVILYQLLTGGRFPYAVVGSMRDVLDNILTARPTPPSRAVPAGQAERAVKARGRPKARGAVDPRLEAVVLKALSKRREDRYATAGELGRDVEDFLAGRATAAGRARRRAHPRRGAVAGTAVGLLLAGAFVATALRQPGRQGTAGGPLSKPAASTAVTTFVWRPPSSRPWVTQPATRPGGWLLVRGADPFVAVDVKLEGRTLVVRGTSGADHLLVRGVAGGRDSPEFKFAPSRTGLFSRDAFDEVRFYLGAGNDELDIYGLCDRPVYMFAEAGDDFVRLMPPDARMSTVLTAPVAVDGGPGHDELVVGDNGELRGQRYRFDPGTLRRSDLPLVSYAGVEEIGFTGGQGNDLYDVDGSSPGTSIHLNCNLGDDTVYVGQAAGRLDAVWGVDVVGGPGHDVLRLFDTAESSDHQYVFRQGRHVSRLGLRYDLYVGTIEHIILSAGSGNDTFDASSTTDAAPELTFDGGPGDDRFLGGSTPDTFVGGPGADHFVGGPGVDTMVDFAPREGDTVADDVEERFPFTGTRPATQPRESPATAPAAATRPAGRTPG